MYNISRYYHIDDISFYVGDNALSSCKVLSLTSKPSHCYANTILNLSDCHRTYQFSNIFWRNFPCIPMLTLNDGFFAWFFNN